MANGGTITFPATSLGNVFDPYFSIGGGEMHHNQYEHLFMLDWILDRDIWTSTPDELRENTISASW